LNLGKQHFVAPRQSAAFAPAKGRRNALGRATLRVAFAASLLVVARPEVHAAVKLPHTDIHSFELRNGLRVFMVEDHQAPVASLNVWYHVGSKDEPPGRTGFAHLFEHLMFQGTTNVLPEQFSDYIVRAGGTDNAYTTEDATVFWETFPSNQLPVVLWLEADRMRNLQITDEVFKNEREVVKEERRMKFDNPPYGTVVEKLYQTAFTIHPYRHMTIGSMEDLDHASLADIRSFYDTYYVPNNAAVVIVGDIVPAEADALVRKYFDPLPRGAPIARHIPAEPAQQAERRLRLTSSVSLPAFVEGFHMPADATPDTYPLRLAAKILSVGESSRIYRRLVYEKQVAVEAESSGNFTEDPNLFFIFAVMNNGNSPGNGLAEVQAELTRLQNQPVSAEELAKAQNLILRGLIESRESSQSRAEELGYDAVVLNDAELVNGEPARILTITAADIQRVAKKYFTPENGTVVEVYSESVTRPESEAEKAKHP
jgi:zinc protease